MRLYFKVPRLLIATLLASSFFGSSVQALTLDEFTAVNSVQCKKEEVWSSNSVESAGSMGGTLTLRCYKELNSGPRNVTLSTDSGFASHSQDFGTVGRSRLEWDGDVDPLTTNFVGLEALDLMQDEANAFILQNVGFDCANGNGGAAPDVRLHFRVYDGKDSSGDNFAEYELPLPCGGDAVYPRDFTIPFASFVGQTSTPDFSSVGSIRITVLGNTQNADLIFGKLTTNGHCTQIPVKGVPVVDLCGVCGGDNSTCKDCLGIPRGNAVLDECGVCNGNGSSCKKQCTESNHTVTISNLNSKVNEFILNAKFFVTRVARSDPAYAKRSKSEIASLKKALRVAINSLPVQTLQCVNTTVCTTSTRNTAVLSRIDRYLNRLYTLSVGVLSKPIGKTGGTCNGSIEECKARTQSSNAKTKSLKTLAKKLRNEALKIKATLPRTVSNCPPGV